MRVLIYRRAVILVTVWGCRLRKHSSVGFTGDPVVNMAIESHLYVLF
jgi:hypothetical protein